jgi:hypothetical protein
MRVKPEQPEHIKNAILAGQAEIRREAEAARRSAPANLPGAPLRSLDEWEALPQHEQLARMDEVDALLAEGQR